MHYVPRALTRTIRRAMSTFPAVLVTGARQTGKTTLLRTEFGRSHQYLSLERPDVRARALADPVAFLSDDGSLRFHGDDQIHRQADQLACQGGQPVHVPLGPSPLDDHVLALHPAQLARWNASVDGVGATAGYPR